MKTIFYYNIQFNMDKFFEKNLNLIQKNYYNFSIIIKLIVILIWLYFHFVYLVFLSETEFSNEAKLLTGIVVGKLPLVSGKAGK